MTHRAVLAYASDHGLLPTALRPHALWFHRPFHADRWLLYVTDSPSAGARGFT